MRSPTGQALGGVLKDAARQALPVAGRAHWRLRRRQQRRAASARRPLPRPGASSASSSKDSVPEDKEFEIAKSFVRFAGDAVRTAVDRAASGTAAGRSRNPQPRRRAARYAPGLLRSAPPALSGRWVRRGRNIVVVNS